MEKIRLRRHHDDHYYDRLDFREEGQTVLEVKIVPRYKTSGLSGDEWRVSCIATYFGPPPVSSVPQETQGYSSMRGAMGYLSEFVMRKTRPDVREVELFVLRKGYKIWSAKYPTLVHVGTCFHWDLTLASEKSPEETGYMQMPDALEKEVCQQVGCAEPKTRIYRLKKRQKDGGDLEDFKYDFEDRHIWFCDRHARRGDCGLEDADKNYEAADGGLPPGEEKVSYRDESESAFGGVIHLSPDEIGAVSSTVPLQTLLDNASRRRKRS